MENVVIRKAIKDDASTIEKLLVEILKFHHHGRPDIFKNSGSKYNLEEVENLIETGIVFVAEMDKRVVGYMLLEEKIIQNLSNILDRRILYIDDIFIDELYRGKKIGTMFIEKCIQYSKEEKYDVVELNVWNFNTSAIKFYEKVGFTPKRTVYELK